ncbi:MAG: hypothetical protein HRT36_02635 [Alphaproteobacteria bacterium]|nr:hypothetical protein [Alphaproteobacteria bacterium]
MHGQTLLLRYEPKTESDLIHAQFMVDRATGKIRECNATCHEALLQLVRLWTASKKTSEDCITKKDQMRLYSTKLSHYPIEAVRETLENLTDNAAWWPSWGEVKDAVQWTIKRQSLDQEKRCKRRAIEHYLRTTQNQMAE